MKKLLWLLLLLPMLALAGTVPLTWTAPTNRTDGSALTNLASYNVYRAASATGPWTSIANVPAPAAGSTDAAAPGGATSYYAVTAVDANGVESAKTTAVSAAVPVSPPMPPTGLTVGAITAYTFEKQADRLAFLAVGTIPLGTACDTTQPVGAYYVVPRAKVTWFGSVQPPLVVAQCS